MFVSAGWWVAVVTLDPGARPAVHRWLAAQLDPRADLRLQRLRPADRQRDRQRRRRRYGHDRRAVGRDRHHPAVRQRDGRPGLLADPDRAGLPGRRASPYHGKRKRTDLDRAHWVLWGTGCSSPGSPSATPRASSTRTTRSPWLRRSARSSAWEPSPSGGSVTRARPAHPDRRRDRCGLLVVRAAAAQLRRLEDPRRPRAGRRSRGRRGLRGHPVGRRSSPATSTSAMAAKADRACWSPPVSWSASPGPSAYALQTASVAHTGSIPSAGPTTSGGHGLRRTRRPGGGFTRPTTGTGATAGAWRTRRLRRRSAVRGGGGAGGLLDVVDAERRPGRGAQGERMLVHLGAGHRRRQQRRRLPARRRRNRSWRSVASTARTRPRRSPPSRHSCRPARCTTSSVAAGSAAARTRRARPPQITSWVEANYTDHDHRRHHGLRPHVSTS